RSSRARQSTSTLPSSLRGSPLDDRSLLMEWKPAYKRGFGMQASLAIAGFLLGLLAWWQTGVWQWLLGAAVLIVNWPYNLLVILPDNNELMDIDTANAGP